MGSGLRLPAAMFFIPLQRMVYRIYTIVLIYGDGNNALVLLLDSIKYQLLVLNNIQFSLSYEISKIVDREEKQMLLK